VPDRPDRSVALVLATSTGGVGAHVRALAAGLIGHGWSVTVGGPAATDELFAFSAIGARFEPIEITGGPRDLAAVRRLQRIGGSRAVLHAHGLRAGTVAALTRARPLVVTWHNTPLDPPGLRRRVADAAQRLVARQADINLAASADLAASVRRMGGRDVRDGPVAVALPPATREAARVRADLGVADGQQLVLSIARLHPQKGLDVLVAAAARWPAGKVAVRIAGDGPLEADLAAQIAATDAPVRLLGRRTDVADLLAASDLVVLPSRWEARSLVAQETLLAGRPLVATAVGGLPALLGDGAVLIDADDVDALDTTVMELLGDSALRGALAARGAEWARTWPTETDTLAQVEAVYAELLGLN
jgi:glycosyltransferase involved in cell wall biosynthesis